MIPVNQYLHCVHLLLKLQVLCCFSESELDRMKKNLDREEKQIQMLQTENEERLAKARISHTVDREQLGEALASSVILAEESEETEESEEELEESEESETEEGN